MFATGFHATRPSEAVGVLVRPKRRRGSHGGDRFVSVSGTTTGCTSKEVNSVMNANLKRLQTPRQMYGNA